MKWRCVRYARLRVLFVLAAVATAGCGGPLEPFGGGEDLTWWGERFVSESVAVDGDTSRSLEPGTEIDVRFEQRDERRIIRWNAGCNTWGGPVEIESARLEIGAVSQSASGCRSELDRQDEWLHDFFTSDPQWQRRGERLTLTKGDTTIEFSRVTDQGVVSVSAFTAAWYGPDGERAERGEGQDRTFEVSARVGPRHCDWESVVFLHVAWPPGATSETGPSSAPVREYVRDPDAKLDADRLEGTLDLDAEMPDDATFTGYHTAHTELWFGPDEGVRYAYLDTEHGVERWPKAPEPIGCA